MSITLASLSTPATQASVAAAKPLSSARSQDTPEKILGTARQFEALLLSQMLKSAHSDGSDGDEEDSGSVMGGIGQEQFATALAQRGGIGLADAIARSLANKTGHPA